MNHNLQIDNRTLVEECKKGNKEALNLFYIRFAPRMLSVIRRYVSDPKDAEDILHDGFIVAFTRLGSLRDFDKVDYWLATIIRNLSLQFLHSQDVAQMLHEIPDVEDTPEIDDIIDLEILESLIRKLPAGYQRVFRLAVLENKSHKEIARLLGIAPNSSSSQLFHAKLMMRKLITDYKKQTGLCILLLSSVSALVLLRLGQEVNRQDSLPVIADNVNVGSAPKNHVEADNSTGLPEDNPATQASGSRPSVITAGKTPGSQLIAASDSVYNNGDQGFSEIKEETNLVADNGSGDKKPEIEIYDNNGTSTADSIPAIPEEPYYAYLDDIFKNRHRDDDWSLRVSVNSGILNFDNPTGNDDYANDPGQSCPNDPPVKPEEKPETEGLTRSGAGGYKNYKDLSHHNHMPISFSATVNKALNNRLSIESGITYTYLHTTFETINAKSECHWHYIGLPLKLNIKTFSSERLKLYASFGGEVDFPVYSNADVTRLAINSDLRPGKFDSSTVWSLSASYGISLRLSKRIDLFLEPTLQYHFNHDHEVPNIWTDNSWGFSLPVGFRFNW